jgi:hypothetical protein
MDEIGSEDTESTTEFFVKVKVHSVNPTLLELLLAWFSRITNDLGFSDSGCNSGFFYVWAKKAKVRARLNTESGKINVIRGNAKRLLEE